MQNVMTNIYSKIFIFGVGLFLIGCASDPVPTYLPVSHPAHPEAAEVVYTATPNPFQDGMSMNKKQYNEAPDISTEEPGNRHSHQMKSDDKNHDKSVETKTEKSGHSKKEHE